MNVDLLARRGGRRVLFTLLYVSEGAPIGYLWWAIPTKLRDGGMPVADVAALGALLTVPWSVKFLWAPLVDTLRSRRFGLRGWIVGAQLLMGLTLLPLAWLDLGPDLGLVVPLLVAHAIAAATQDVAIDALAVRHVPEAERGHATGWMQIGMLGGRAVFGGVALALERALGAPLVVLALVATLWCASLLVLLADDRGGGIASTPRARARLHAFATRLAQVLRQRRTWLGLGFASIAGAGMEATGGLAGPLMVDRGLSQEQVGSFFALPAVGCMAAGLLLGGWLADRVRRLRAVAGALVTMALWIGLVAQGAAGAVLGPVWPLLVALGGAYVLFGVLTATSFALLMDLTDPSLGGTQFSAYMGAVNLCYVWSISAAGALAGRFDYAPALLLMAGASLLALLLLPALARHERDSGLSRGAGSPGSRDARSDR